MKLLEKLKKIYIKIKNGVKGLKKKFIKKKSYPFSPLTGSFIDDSDE